MCDNELLMMTCQPLPPGTPPLTGHDLEHKLSHAEGWEIGWPSSTRWRGFRTARTTIRR